MVDGKDQKGLLVSTNYIKVQTSALGFTQRGTCDLDNNSFHGVMGHSPDVVASRDNEKRELVEGKYKQWFQGILFSMEKEK